MTALLRAVWFDLYGTLLDLSPLGDACERVAPGRGKEFSAAWRAEQLRLTWLRTIAERWADFEDVTAEALASTARRSGVDADAAAGVLDRSFDRLPAHPQAASVLDGLRAREIEVGVLSNGSATMIERALAETGLAAYLDRVASVDAVERYKPHPDTYGLALAASGGPAGSIGFVTANDWDAAGAASVGLRTFWLAPPDAAPPPALSGARPIRSSWEGLLDRLSEGAEDDRRTLRASQPRDPREAGRRRP